MDFLCAYTSEGASRVKSINTYNVSRVSLVSKMGERSRGRLYSIIITSLSFYCISSFLLVSFPHVLTYAHLWFTYSPGMIDWFLDLVLSWIHFPATEEVHCRRPFRRLKNNDFIFKDFTEKKAFALNFRGF